MTNVLGLLRFCLCFKNLGDILESDVYLSTETCWLSSVSHD